MGTSTQRDGRGRRSGKIVVLVAVMLPTVLVPLLAIGVDGGNMMNDQRRVQAAADAAALRAATQLYYDNKSHRGNQTQLQNTFGAELVALDTLDVHKFTMANCQARTVNIPATSSNPRVHQKPGTVEVIVSHNQSRWFSAIWGSDQMQVSARAVARVRSFSQGAGVILLEDDEDQALYGRGNGVLLVNEGNVAVNSTGVSAAQTDGSNTVLASTGFDVTGSYTGDRFFETPYPSSGSTVPYTNATPVQDPLAYLPEPKRADFVPQVAPPNEGPGGSVIVLEPGRYTTRLYYDGPRKLFLKPGIYFLERGIQLQGQVTMVANEVMLYNAGSGVDNINLGGQGKWTLTPPTSGVYEGISIFQARTTADPTTTMIIRGNGGSGMTGTIYNPTTETLILGNGVQTLGSQYISRTLEMAGDGTFTIDYPSARGDISPDIELVE